MITSKKPMIGAMYFRPFAMKMTLIVPRLTSQMRKKNIRRGNITHAKRSDDATGSAIAFPPYYRIFQTQPRYFIAFTTLPTAMVYPAWRIGTLFPEARL